ncbi:unnamed protein product [Rotaria sp. Silwood2]|nr:unnamed protein product [Rotaria sp. Silwood2]CAF2866115.1 unnamed protein product [Rotaria sp. Silwood2]CAF3064763.1 unnamed protein product [Rotaria sp. Silwood2]CAF3182878.1 unnamed protein product [Rotaria sp. Silwood2]CAF4183280.1 unnamed protein product [Rotaria sp. Silwood2]
MVKQKSYAYNDRDMNQYKTRTLYGGQANNYQQNPSENNHVPVAKSSGCCCRSKKSNTISPRPTAVVQSQPPPLTAHEKAHMRLDPTDPFYHRHGRINKNQNQTKNSYQQKKGKNKTHSTVQTTYTRQSNKNSNPPVQSTAPPTTKKQSSCCTIL